MRKYISFFLIFVLLFQFITPITSEASKVENNNELKTIGQNNEEDIYAFPEKTNKKVELKQKRKQNEQTFLNPDGTFTTEVYPEPIFWKNKSGEWKDIDNDMTEVDSQDISSEDKVSFKELKNKSNLFDIRLKKNSKANNFMKFSIDDYELSMTPQKTLSTKAINKENRAIYENIFNQTDFNYTYTSLGVKEDIILKDNTAPNQFQFEIKTKDLIPKIEENILKFYNKEDELVLQTTSFFAYDKKDVVNRDISLSLEELKKSKTWIFTITLDNQWLRDKEREFPVVIDPSVNVQFNNEEISESFVYEGSKNSNYHDFSYIRAGNNGYGDSKAFVKFSLPQLPSSAVIQSAKLDLFSYSTNNPSNTLQIYEVTSNWEDSLITWNNQPSISSSPFSEFLGGGSSNALWMTSLVKSWYDGTKANYGIMMQTKDPKANKHEFLSTENPDYTKNPKLTITYNIDAIGLEEFWTFDNNVNLFNGNLFYEELDTSLDGRGIPILVGRFYNSKLKNVDSVIGKGWNINFNDRLVYKDPENSKVVKYIESDGTSHYFTFNDDYWEAMGLSFDLNYDDLEKTFVMIDKDGTKYEYDTHGYLLSIVDSNDNKTTYTRDTNHNVSKITDASGRIFYLTYEDGMLTKVSGNETITVQYLYDSKKRLIEVRKLDSKNNIITKNRYEYNENNDLISTYDNADNKTLNKYDEQGRISGFEQYATSTDVTNTINTNYIYRTNSTNYEVVKKNNKSINTLFVLNDFGNLIKLGEDYNDSTKKSSRETIWTWNQNNLISKIIDPLGNATFYEYDEEDNLVRSENSKGYHQLLKYDNKNNLTQETGYVGQSFINYYDKRNNLTNILDPNGNSTILNYNEEGNLISETKPTSIGNNLLKNSGFDDWSGTLASYWQYTSGSVGEAIKTNDRKNGDYAIKLISNSPESEVKVISDYVKVEENKSYILSWASKSLTKNGESSIRIKWYSDVNTYLNQNSFEKATEIEEWTERNSTITSPNGAIYARIEVYSKDKTVQFDNIQLEEGTFINEYDFLVNGDFEIDNNKDGHPDNFSKANIGDKDGIDKNIRFIGDNSLLLNGIEDEKNYYQTINYSGEKGTSILISGFAKGMGLSSSGGDFSVVLEIHNTDGTLQYETLQFPKNTFDWLYKEIEVKSEKDYQSFRIILKLDNQIKSKVWFDSIMVRTISKNNPSVSQYNLISNSSFEDVENGNVYGWNFNYSGTKPVYSILQYEEEIGEDIEPKENEAFVGKRAFKVTPKEGYVNIVPKKSEPRKENINYTASVVVKAEEVTIGGAHLYLRAYDENNKWLGDKKSTLIQNTNDWKRYSVTLLKDEFPTAKYIRPFIQINPNSNGTYTFDSVRFEEGNITSEINYDSKGNYITSIVNEQREKTSFDVDSRGNLLQITYPSNRKILFSYDDLNRLTSSTNANGLKKEYIYDKKNGDLLETKYFNSSSFVSSTKTTYDDLGRTTSEIDANGKKTEYEYDELGQVISIKQPNNKNTNYRYDNLGQITNISYIGDNSSWNYNYDKVGNISKIIKNNSEITSMDYDSKSNQLTKVIYPSNSNKTNELNFQYNQNGNINFVTPKFSNYNNEAFSFYYDDSGMLKTLKGSQKENYSVIYDEQGRISKTTFNLDGGQKQINYFKYDEKGQLIEQRIENEYGVVVEKDVFLYDISGNIIKIEHHDNSYELYNYDISNQLINEKEYDSNSKLLNEITYTYDILGNRLSMSDGNETIYYTFDKSNQLSTINNSPLSYDEVGNRTKDNEYNYSYDANHQLTTVKDLNGNIIANYDYDYDGLRNKKITQNDTQNYYYIGNALHYITDENNNMLYSFTRDENGRLLSMTDNSSGNSQGITYEYILNYRGDVLGLKDKNGVIVASYKYDSWGNIVSETGSANTNDGKKLYKENPFRYASYFYDEETELYYVNARYYDAKNAVFLTRDSVDYDNLYSYVANNPLKYTDSTGDNWKNIIFRRNPLGIIIDILVDEVGEDSFKAPKGSNKYTVKNIGFLTFNALKKYKGYAGKGNAWHHIVEQHQGNLKKFGAFKIHNNYNIISLKHEGKGSLHRVITGYYNGKDVFTFGKTVRQWISTRTFEEQFVFGIKQIERIGKGKVVAKNGGWVYVQK